MTITNILLTLDEPIDVTTPETATLQITAEGFTDFNIRVFAQAVDATGLPVGGAVDLGGISSITSGGTSSAPIALNVAGLNPLVDYRFYAEDLISTTTSTPTAPLDVTCFAQGTQVLTARGEVPVEALRVGDLVVSMQGAGARMQPITWIGRLHVELRRRADRATVAPVLIKVGALADGMPHRDLRVSPEHALFLDGCLVPAGLLVNGTSIVQETWCPEVTYWHVELPEHAVLVAEGAPAESYLDDGNRHLFGNAGVVALFHSLALARDTGRYDALACHRVLRGGPMLEALRLRLARRSGIAVSQRERAG